MVGSCFIYKLGMLTGQRFQAELSPSFLWKFTEFRAETPPHAFGIPNCVIPPHVFGIPVQETPSLSRNSKMPPVVWYGYFLESPNGPQHHYTTVLLYLVQVDKAFSVKLMEYNQFEAGKGKTVLDTHFTRVSHKTVRWVSVGNDLDTREKLGNLLEVISTLYLSNGLT